MMTDTFHPRYTSLDMLDNNDLKYRPLECVDRSHIMDEPMWTLVDTNRLISTEHLYNRSIEFHNNDHVFRTTIGGEWIRSAVAPNMQDIVLISHRISSTRFRYY